MKCIYLILLKIYIYILIHYYVLVILVFLNNKIKFQIIYIVIITIQFIHIKMVCIKLLKIIFGVLIKLIHIMQYNVYTVFKTIHIKDFFGM